MPVRHIQAGDNQAIAAIIRQSLKDAGLDQPGTAYTDPQLDHLFEYYNALSRSAYFIFEEEGQIIGGAGFGPINQGICELQKCYVSSSHRRKGIATTLLTQVENKAQELGYQSIYLESSSDLREAISFYLKNDYIMLEEPLPNEQGHHLMDIWMLKHL